MKIHEILERQAEARPDSPALADTLGNTWTFGELNAAAHALGKTLSEAGARPGDRVLMLVENCAPAVAAIFACSRIGAVIIPFNARQTDAEVARVIDHATPAVILATSAASPDGAAHAARLGAAPIEGVFGALDLATRPSEPDDSLDDVAVILYTTGTTGTPKGVMLTHDNLLFTGETSARRRGLGPADRIYGVLPISHVFGLASIVIASTVAGAAIRMEPRFRVENLYAALGSGITVLSAVPQMLAKLIQYTKEQGFERLPSATLRYLSSGAAPLDPDWKRRIEAFFGMPLQNGYGMTEATAGICMTDHRAGGSDISVGPPLAGVELRLDHAAAGASEEVGEIMLRGRNVMKGYFRHPEATALALDAEGWLRTGDLGSWDEAGHLHIRGRSKELIIHGGFNIYPPEVEAALNDHPQVIQSAVIGHREGGDEMVIAFVEAARSDWPDEAELRAFAATRLAPYKRPARIILAESLPAAATGKILKHELPALLKKLDAR